jgi:serine/threonine protein kinase
MHTYEKGNANVVRTYKICDFGLARAFSSEEVAGADGQERGRSMTAGVGTPRYMAPEVISSNKQMLDSNPFACDLYSYAILAWSIIAGSTPYMQDKAAVATGAEKRRSVHQTLHMIVAGMRPEIPPEACSFTNMYSAATAEAGCEGGDDRDDINDSVLTADNRSTAAMYSVDDVPSASPPWPTGIGNVLTRCWDADAAQRPDFGWVMVELIKLESSFAACKNKGAVLVAPLNRSKLNFSGSVVLDPAQL